MDAAHYTLAQRQRWMAVLAHSLPEELARYVDNLHTRPCARRKPAWCKSRAVWAAPARAFIPVTPP